MRIKDLYMVFVSTRPRIDERESRTISEDGLLFDRLPCHWPDDRARIGYALLNFRRRQPFEQAVEIRLIYGDRRRYRQDNRADKRESQRPAGTKQMAKHTQEQDSRTQKRKKPPAIAGCNEQREIRAGQ